MKTLPTLFVIAALLGVAPLMAGDADEPQPPAELRERAEQLEQKARVLKSEGRHDEAKQLMQEAGKLSGLAASAKRPPGEMDRKNPNASRTEVRELRQLRAKLQGELEQARARDNKDAVAGLEERMAGVDRQMARLAQSRGGRPGADRPGAPGDGPRPEAPGPEPQERLRHLEIAVDQLHAAGMHDVADRLARERENMVRSFGNARPEGQALMPELRRLQAEMNELRQAVGRLNAQLEEMQRAKKQP